MNLWSLFKGRLSKTAAQAASERPSLSHTDLKAQVQSCLADGHLAEAWRLLEPELPSMDDPEVLAMSVHVCLLHGDSTEAMRWMEKALSVSPTHTDVLRSQAILARYLGQHEVEFRALSARLTARQGIPRLPELTETLRALADWSTATRQVPKREITRLLAFYKISQQLGELADRDAFVEQLYRLQGFADQAFDIWRNQEPNRAGTQLKWASDIFLAKHHPTRLTHHADGADRLVRLAEIRDVCVWSGWANTPALMDLGLMVHGHHTMRARTRREDPASQLVLYGSQSCVLNSVEKRTEVNERSLLLGSSGNYYHFVVEHMGRLAVLDALGVSTAETLCWINGEVLPFQADFLKLAGIEPSQLRSLPLDHLVHFDVLTAPFPPTLGGHETSAVLPNWARRLIVPRAQALSVSGPELSKLPKRLYLSRKNTARRRVHNEASSVWPWLAQQGFVFVEPESLSVMEQVVLFSQAECVVGGSGAALTNMVFMPTGGKVLLALNRHFPPQAQNQFFPPLAKACGHQIHVLPCAPVNVNGNRAMDADVQIDIGELRSALLTLGVGLVQ